MLPALLLGVIQGLTEFLPVSSSGHLVLFGHILPVAGDPVLFDLIVHMGTLLPVVFFYRQDLLKIVRAPFVETGPLAQRPATRLALFVLLGTLPTGLIGVLFEDWFEQMFSEPKVLVVSFSITAALMVATYWARKRDGKTTEIDMLWWQALLIGVCQGLAITPGISRSGTTIAVALFLGLQRDYAAKFSFLLSIPAISGAFLLKARDADPALIEPAVLGVGFVSSAVAGYLALVLLVRLVRKGGFHWFAPYVLGMALFSGLLGWGVIDLGPH